MLGIGSFGCYTAMRETRLDLGVIQLVSLDDAVIGWEANGIVFYMCMYFIRIVWLLRALFDMGPGVVKFRV